MSGQKAHSIERKYRRLWKQGKVDIRVYSGKVAQCHYRDKEEVKSAGWDPRNTSHQCNATLCNNHPAGLEEG